MKRIEYTLKDIKTNIRRNKRKMVCVFLVSVLIGVLIGGVQGITYTCPENSLDDTIVQSIDISTIKKDEAYYYNVFTEIKYKYYALSTYIDYLKEVSISGDTSECLNKFESSFSEITNLYTKFDNYYFTKTPIFFNDKNNAIEYIETQISINKEKAEDADLSLNILNNYSFSNTFFGKSEEEAFSNKAHVDKEIKIWEKQLKMVQNEDSAVIKSINEKMDILIDEFVEIFNEKIQEFNALVEQIEEHEQYDIVYNPYLLKKYILNSGISGDIPKEKALSIIKKTALIYARSVAGVDSPKERFYSIITFFTLFGITVSILYGAFKRKEDE